MKVISGDNPITVGAIARAVGIPGADEPVDARDAARGPRRARPACSSAHVGVRPGAAAPEAGDGPRPPAPGPHGRHDRRRRQRRAGAQGRRHGRGHGLGQRRQPGRRPARAARRQLRVAARVVAEGRRVIANVERVANLFVTKSVYAAVLAFAVGLTNQRSRSSPGTSRSSRASPSASRPSSSPWPRTTAEPSRASCGGWPASRSRRDHRRLRHLLRLQPRRRRRRVAGRGPHLGADRPVPRRHVGLVLLARPLNEWKAALLGAMGVGFLLALTTEVGQDFFELQLPPLLETMAVIGVAAVAIGLMEVGWDVADWWANRFGAAPAATTAAADDRLRPGHRGAPVGHRRGERAPENQVPNGGSAWAARRGRRCPRRRRRRAWCCRRTRASGRWARR